MYKIYTIPINISHPQLLRDGSRTDGGVVLQQYFHDIYTLYLNRLTAYALSGTHQYDSAQKLRSLLEEIIKVKTLICNEESQKQDTIE